jgi:TolB protein
LALAPSANAAFPGANGKIAFSRCCVNTGGDIWTANPDGTGAVDVSKDNNSDTGDSDPAWSPDGTRIAFMREHKDTGSNSFARNIWVMNADGTGQHNLTPNDPNAPTRVDEYTPTWSPDGTKIAFVRVDIGQQFCCPVIPGSTDIWTMNADGTGLKNITNTPSNLDEHDPAWSPDGKKIAFAGVNSTGGHIFTVNADGTGNQQELTTGSTSHPNWSPWGNQIVFSVAGSDNILRLWVMNADGSNQTQITDPPVSQQNQGDTNPAWSPAGDKIVFETNQNESTWWGLATVNPDGTDRAPFTPLTGNLSFQPDWQPIPYTGYPRPKGATPMRVSLVPAYQPCSSANDTHGAPLAFPSCAPPVQASGRLTLGTPPQEPTNAVGSVTARVITGDVQLAVSITDVRNQGSLSDYSGQLETRLPLRVTDKDGGVNATTQDFPFSFAVPCAATADTTVGSTCSVVTTADTLMPGAVTTGLRAIWALGQIGVYDGGADGLASTTGDNTLFMDQGIFVP